MYLYRISDKLLRLQTEEQVKDIWLDKGKIIEPIHEIDILTDLEKEYVIEKMNKL